MPATTPPSPKGDEALRTTHVAVPSPSPQDSSMATGGEKVTEEIWISRGCAGTVTEVSKDVNNRWRGSITDSEDIIHEVFSGPNLQMGQKVSFSCNRYTKGKRWHPTQVTALA